MKAPPQVTLSTRRGDHPEPDANPTSGPNTYPNPNPSLISYPLPRPMTSVVPQAARHGHQDVLITLLFSGADPNQPDKRGDTPLELACRMGHKACRGLMEVSKATRAG